MFLLFFFQLHKLIFSIKQNKCSYSHVDSAQREQMGAGQPNFSYSLGTFCDKTPLKNEWKIQWV